MGKQINYWMEYESFLSIAEAAIEQGCVIYKEHNGKVVGATDLSIVTKGSWDCCLYHFHVPIAGEIEIRTLESGGEVINSSNSSTSNAIIEAGYSYTNNKRIVCNRLYVRSGYYNDCEEWIPRPECVTKIYNSLARKVKKLAPYTEFTDIRTYTAGEHQGETFEYKHKEYITPYCLELMKNGYSLC